MQIFTTLTSAAPRVITPRNGSAPFTIYEIFDHEGQAWRVKQDSYGQLLGLIGQTIEIVGRIEQNGNFTNRYADLVQVAQAGTQVPATNAAQQAMQAAIEAQRVQPTVPQQQAQPSQTAIYPTLKDASITRQTAGKVAALISSSPSEFWANIVDLAIFFDTGQLPANPSEQEFASATAGGYNDGDEIPF